MLATSEGSPQRPMGVRDSTLRRWASLLITDFRTRSVRMVPGPTALTRMPCGISPTAITAVNCLIPPFDTA